jgi:histo-blood group ABO system transferase
MNVGLLIIATNKYTEFLKPLIESADSFFLKNHDVTYFVFTNKDVEIQTNRKIIRVLTDHKEWPWMTLGRYRIFTDNYDKLSKMDYLFYCDADMRFVGDVGVEILGDMVGTIHPGFYNNPNSSNIALEKRLESLAYLPPSTIKNYYAGGFNGGSSSQFLKMSRNISDNIDFDLKKHNIIAEWHDESHMNKYFFENEPTIKLSPSYCYPESWSLPFEKKLLALDKNHNEIRK